MIIIINITDYEKYIINDIISKNYSSIMNKKNISTTKIQISKYSSLVIDKYNKYNDVLLEPFFRHNKTISCEISSNSIFNKQYNSISSYNYISSIGLGYCILRCHKNNIIEKNEIVKPIFYKWNNQFTIAGVTTIDLSNNKSLLCIYIYENINNIDEKYFNRLYMEFNL